MSSTRCNHVPSLRAKAKYTINVVQIIFIGANEQLQVRWQVPRQETSAEEGGEDKRDKTR